MSLRWLWRRPQLPARWAKREPRRHLGLRTILAAGGGLLILLVLASAAIDMQRTRVQTLRSTEHQLMNLTGALAGETAGALTGVDAALTAVADLAGQGQQAVIQAPLREDAARLPQLRSAAVFDADGRLVHVAGADDVGWPVSATDRPFFVAQRAKPTTGLFIGLPQGINIVVSRPVLSPGGGFAGVVAAALDLQQFERFYRSVQLGRGGVVSLFRADGTLLARYPRVPAALGHAYARPAELGQALANAGGVTLGLRDPLDAQSKLVAMQVVPGLPLVVAVGVDKGAALQPWAEQARHATARTILLCAVIVGLILLLRRELERREGSEMQLRESEERYALAMAGSNEGHWDWDLTEDRVYVSARLQKLLGVGNTDVVASSADYLARLHIHSDDAARARAVLAAHLEGKTAFYECECRVQGADGYRWLRVRGLALRDGRGRPYRMSGSVADISEHKAAEEERTKLEARLRQAQRLEAIGTMAGGIAHDFNNRLGAILGYGEMAHNAAAQGSALKRHVGNVMTAANRARALIDQILSYSRTQRGKRVPVCVAGVLEETLELVRAALPPDIELEVVNAAGNTSVICDPTHAHQLAMNLCTNAIQAMPNGGRLTVALTLTDATQEQMLTSGVLPLGRYLRLTVQDTGSGMTPEVLSRIFEPFFTTKEAGGGTGLGLALVQDIVADLGGGIHVTSVPGRGSSFEIYLPSCDAVAQPPHDRMPIPHGAGEHVLLVEDEKALMLLGEELLAALGYEPAGFAGSKQALQAFEADPTQFDAVVTDQVMPDMSGIQLARRIRTLRADLPVILVSGYRGQLLAQEALAAGIDEVLTKPLDARELASALARVLKRKPVHVD